MWCKKQKKRAKTNKPQQKSMKFQYFCNIISVAIDF